ncbi:syntaxin-18 [Diabrotica virgifera virgifera]|uniref:Syntaxin-18 n=1 Tax=Diabrotica virgifera virgifera TaxID=50390 RepID=A0A6P7GIF4_DIAVI|nr:syntaxin-18 [Diabrotica virgifera virgifera]
MDITALFKACVKTVRTTNKSLGIRDQKSNILKTHRDIHLSTARDIVKQITKLQSFLLENKAAYLNVINYLSTNKTMSEIDRQKVDTMAEEIINNCSKLIKEYKKEITALSKSSQKEEHYQNVIDSLECYLKNVSKIYTEAKAVRVKRVIETHKLSKLETKPVSQKQEINNSQNKATLDIPNNVSSPKENVRVPPASVDYDNQLSAEEMQMFETENNLLYNELNSISDEVRQMESKVVHIAELQELFTEKVLQQQADIERIATTVVGSTENMKDANEQIRQAIQRNAGLRVYILFFLLVMSFSLLFLDWYND